MAQRGLTAAEVERFWAIERGEIPERTVKLQIEVPEPFYNRLHAVAKLNGKSVSYYVIRGLRWAFRKHEREHGPIMPPDPTLQKGS